MLLPRGQPCFCFEAIGLIVSLAAGLMVGLAIGVIMSRALEIAVGLLGWFL